jgi:hypothetical protein
VGRDRGDQRVPDARIKDGLIAQHAGWRLDGARGGFARGSPARMRTPVVSSALTGSTEAGLLRSAIMLRDEKKAGHKTRLLYR